MKKLMVTAFAVAFAAVAQAAQVTWSATKGAIEPNQTTVTSYSVLLIDAAEYSLANAMDDLSAGAFNYEEGAVLRQTSGIAQTVTGANYFRFTESKQDQLATSTQYAKGDVVTAYAIVFNNSVADATYAMITKTVTSTVTDAGIMTFGFGGMDVSGTVSQSWTALAPEPTSGLMMLLGMGVLALRRRRA